MPKHHDPEVSARELVARQKAPPRIDHPQDDDGYSTWKRYDESEIRAWAEFGAQRATLRRAVRTAAQS